MGLLKDTTITSCSKVITLVLGLGIASANAWLLGPEGRGQLAVYIIVGTLLMIISSNGIEMAAAYYAGTGKHRLSNVLVGVIFVMITASLISVVIGYLLWFYQPAFIRKVSGFGLIFCVCYVPTLLLFQSMLWVHSALGNMKLFAAGSIICTAATLPGVLILCGITRKPEYAMLSYVMGTFLAGFYMLFALLRKHKLEKLRISFQCLKDLYKYGIKYYFARLAQFLNVQIGTFVIAFFGSMAEIGFFATAIGLVAKMTILPEISNVVLLSRVVKGQQASIELTAKAVRLTFWVILFASVILALFCKIIVMVVLSPKFLPVVVPIWFLLPGMLMRCCSKTLGVYFNGIGKPEINSIAIVSAVATNVVIMLWLLPLYGITGAAIAATCGYLADAVVLIAFYKFAFNHPVRLLIPRVGDITSLMVSLFYRRPGWLYGRKNQKDV